ncbi:MAG: ASKHA domain-containing protein [Armatimonadota bacterium]
MPIVRFLPSDVVVEVASGSLIHEAAIKGGIEELHLPCGGKGTCGRCLVEVIQGTLETAEQMGASEKKLVLACKTKVTGDLTVKLLQKRQTAMQVVGDSHFLVDEDCLPDPNALTPLYCSQAITVPPASIEEHYSDWQRVVREYTRVHGNIPMTTGTSVLQGLAEALRSDNGRITVDVQEYSGIGRVLNVQPGKNTSTAFGLAIDVGTTTVAVQLVNLHDGTVMANRTSYNAQISRGADIISRIDYARSPERLAELRDMIVNTINTLIIELAAGVNIKTDNIYAGFIAGNTTMMHLLLALPPRHIRETPYVPTVNSVPSLTAHDVGLAINPSAVVECSPGVGSYVGGDITSGLLCTDIYINSEDVFMFLDIGTNGEIVLGNASWMVTCACSAGPAFEGSGIKCGIRAMEGAIEYVTIATGGSEIQYDVVGGGKPSGICGSGLISLLGEMLLRGVIDQSGRFNTEMPTGRWSTESDINGYIIEFGNNTVSGQDLVITEPDIANLLRTKAAIYAACSLLISSVGIEWNNLSCIYIAGGFGRYIEIDDAILIGLLPDLPYDTFKYIGNSSLTGAYIALLSREHRQKLSELAAGMTYIDLSSDTRYMDSYLGAMFLPHTDLAQFPTVANRFALAKSEQEPVTG